MTATTASVIPWLVFSDDWGRHPSSCQHLIRHALPQQPVTWVNMIGTRRPRLDRATLVRGWEKLGQWARPRLETDDTPENLNIVSPKVWPGFRWRWERRLNRAMLARQLRSVLHAQPEAPIAVTTMPTAADLVGAIPVRSWVYYCVDDFSRWPGIDRVAARRLEDQLFETADVVVAVSEPLAERAASRGRPVHLLTHGVDLDFWACLPKPIAASPVILFWGLIDRRMDVEFVRHLSAALPQATIRLVGPVDNADPELERVPRVERRPGVPLDQLPALAADADVLVMPYIDAPVTRAMQPLKLKEYLATGKPVVVRDLPANREWSDALDVAATSEHFASAVRERLRTGLPACQALARRRLEAESWAAKARTFADLVRSSV